MSSDHFTSRVQVRAQIRFGATTVGVVAHSKLEAQILTGIRHLPSELRGPTDLTIEVITDNELLADLQTRICSFGERVQKQLEVEYDGSLELASPPDLSELVAITAHATIAIVRSSPLTLIPTDETKLQFLEKALSDN